MALGRDQGLGIRGSENAGVIRGLEPRIPNLESRIQNPESRIPNPESQRTLRDVTGDQWRAFWAVFLGWVVDSFDFNILTFIVIDIQRSFTVSSALAGALGTVTLVMRLAGVG